jgi:hypothetical protein
MLGTDIEIYVSDHGDQDIVVSVVTSLWAGQFGVQILAGPRDFSVLQNVKTSSRAHPAFWSVGTERSFLGGRAIRV